VLSKRKIRALCRKGARAINLNVNKLRTRSCIIDGKAAATMAQLRRIRYRRHDASVFLYAFDLIELNGDDLRRDPLEVRKATLASSWPRPVLACG
jgi:ATP-dependent DNA ligase